MTVRDAWRKPLDGADMRVGEARNDDTVLTHLSRSVPAGPYFSYMEEEC